MDFAGTFIGKSNTRSVCEKNDIDVREIVEAGESPVSSKSGSGSWRRELLNETVQNARIENYNAMLFEWKDMVCNPCTMSGSLFRIRGCGGENEILGDIDMEQEDDCVSSWTASGETSAAEGFGTYVFTGCNKNENIMYFQHTGDKSKRTSFSYVEAFEMFVKGRFYPVDKDLCLEIARLVIRFSSEKKYEGSEWNWAFAKAMEESLLSTTVPEGEMFFLPLPPSNLVAKYTSILKERAASSPDSRKNRRRRAEMRKRAEIVKAETEKNRCRTRQIFFFERELLNSLSAVTNR